MLLAIAAGVGFGLYFVAMKMAGPRWPPLAHGRRPHRQLSPALRSSCSPPCAAHARLPPRPPSAYLPRKAVLWALAPALLDTGGNLLFMAATRTGRLDVAAVLASLYPASTILLAAWMLHERPTRRQALGMAHRRRRRSHDHPLNQISQAVSKLSYFAKGEGSAVHRPQRPSADS